MPSSLVPLSQVQPAAVEEYLARQGIPAAIAEWKYFDRAFAPGRERGYVLIRDARVSGFLGAIPFTMRLRGQAVQTAWTCDWSSDADAGAAGLLLAKQMLCAYDPYFQLGGNENTLKIMPRMAAFTGMDTGILFYLPLRVGAVLSRARLRAPAVPFNRISLLNRLPLGIPPRRTTTDKVAVQPGVSSRVAQLFQGDRGGGCYPEYDAGYLEWQLGRCPVLEAFTICAPADEPLAAALCWREKPAGKSWRLALSSVPAALQHLDLVLAAGLRHIYQSGGEIAFALAARSDSALVSLLESRHFRKAPRRRMFCAVSGRKGEFEEPVGLSLLDTDMAYRF